MFGPGRLGTTSFALMSVTHMEIAFGVGSDRSHIVLKLEYCQMLTGTGDTRCEGIAKGPKSYIYIYKF